MAEERFYEYRVEFGFWRGDEYRTTVVTNVAPQYDVFGDVSDDWGFVEPMIQCAIDQCKRDNGFTIEKWESVQVTFLFEISNESESV